MGDMKPCRGCKQSIDSAAPVCFSCGLKRPGSRGLGKLVVVAGAALVLLIGFAAGSFDENATRSLPRTAVGAPLAVAAPTPALEVSADDLFRAYDDNEVDADSRYRGRTLIVTGIVNEIRKNLFDDVIIELQVASNRFRGVDAHLKDSETNAARALKKRQQVTVACVGAAKVMVPQLNDCVLR